MKHRHYYIYVCAAACLLSGCGTYTCYERPNLDVNTDSLYRTSMVSSDSSLIASEFGADSCTIASKPWHEFFTDPCLQSLITIGLERNTDLRIAHLQTEEAQAVLQNARLSYQPAVNLNPQAGISHYNGETKKTYNIGATASWEVDIFGRITNAKREAIAALEQSQAYAQAGKTNDVAVHQACANRTALNASMLTIRKSISETENALSALLKEPAHTIKRSTLAGQHFSDDLSLGLPLSLLSNRPDVRQAEAALAESFYATNSARAAFYPTLTLSGSLGWTNNGGGSILNPGKWLSSAIASLTAPLFNKGTNIANLKIAQARQQEATLRFEQSLLDAGNEVNDALAEWQTADSRIALDRQQIADLEAATEKTNWLVRYTSANYLEVLTAQLSFLNAQLTLAQDRIGKIQAVIHLYHALGGGEK